MLDGIDFRLVGVVLLSTLLLFIGVREGAAGNAFMALSSLALSCLTALVARHYHAEQQTDEWSEL